jgi:hypothetical protein
MQNHRVTFFFQNLAAYSRPLNLVVHAKNAVLRSYTARSAGGCLISSDPMMTVEWPTWRVPSSVIQLILHVRSRIVLSRPLLGPRRCLPAPGSGAAHSTHSLEPNRQAVRRQRPEWDKSRIALWWYRNPDTDDAERFLQCCALSYPAAKESTIFNHLGSPASWPS